VPITRDDRVEMDLEPGTQHEQWRLDLDELARCKERADRGERLRSVVDRRHARTRHPHHFGAGPRILRPGIRAHARAGPAFVHVDEGARHPPACGRDANISALAADDRDRIGGRPIDGDDAAARHYLLTRSTYSCVRVSILIVSPTRMNSGTLISAPVS